MEILEKQKEDIINEIKHGDLDYFIDTYDIELVKKNIMYLCKGSK